MKKTIALILLLVLWSSPAFPFDWDNYRFYPLEGNGVTYDEVVNTSPRTILFLWTTWCHYCRNELKRINASPAPSDDIKVYYINLGEPSRDVRSIVKRLKLRKDIIDNILIDPNAALAYRFKIIGVPLYAFFKDGKLIHKAHFIDDAVIKKVYENASNDGLYPSGADAPSD